jgi:hypothetical protein
MLNPGVKRICATRSTLILALLGCVFLLVGCDFYQTPDTSASTNMIPPKVAEVPVLSGPSNSYPMVKAHLDLGGNFLLYLDTEQWMTILNKKLDIWRQVVSSTPEIAMDEQQKKRLFDAVQQFIADSGLEEISGIGLSAAPLEPVHSVSFSREEYGFPLVDPRPGEAAFERVGLPAIHHRHGGFF